MVKIIIVFVLPQLRDFRDAIASETVHIAHDSMDDAVQDFCQYIVDCLELTLSESLHKKPFYADEVKMHFPDSYSLAEDLVKQIYSSICLAEPDTYGALVEHANTRLYCKDSNSSMRLSLYEKDWSISTAFLTLKI
jgi:hypothetical protein